MKKLTKSKRSNVRFLIKRATQDLQTAKFITFKSYGSHELSTHLEAALAILQRSIKHLDKTKFPKTAVGISPVDRQGNFPAKGKKCPMPEESTTQKVQEDEIDTLFKEVVCDQLCVHPEQCQPQASLIEDLGADDLDPTELSMPLAEAFKIRFSNDEVESFTTYEKLLNLVKAKVAAQRNNSNKVL